MLRLRKPTKLSGDNHQFIINKKSKKLIIFFSGTGAATGYFSFYSEGRKLDCNVLFINNGENEWYQKGIPSLGTSTLDETVLLIKKWISFLNITEVYTCGSSMGAYGALLYGTQLKAKVLAFVPEIELLKSGGRTETHMKKDQYIYHDLINLLKNSNNQISIYAGENDPVDIYHAALLASFVEFPNIDVFSIRDESHTFAVRLRDKNILTQLLRDFSDNKKMVPLPIAGKSCGINGFSEAYYWEYYHFKQKNYEDAIKYGMNAVSKYPTASFAQYLLGSSYVQLGKFVAGLTHLSIARSLTPTNLNYQFAVANCLRRMGEEEKAKYLHNKTLQATKEHAKTHYDLSILYTKMGDKKGALARANHALRIEPKNASFQKRVEKLTQVKKK